MRLTKIVLGALLPVALTAGVVLSPASEVSAASPPPTTTSWYVGSNWYNTFNGKTDPSKSVWWNFGYNASNGGEVILDFARLDISGGVYGLDPWEYGFQSFSTVQNEIEQVMVGYDANSAHTQNVDLIIGTSNSGDNGYTQAEYTTFAQDIRTMLSTLEPLSIGVFPDFGDDVEPQWGAPIYPEEFLSAYDTADQGYPFDFWDYGWLDGTVTSSSTSNTSCSAYGVTQKTGQWTWSYPTGWTPCDLDYLAFNGYAQAPFLQIYDSSWANQLQELDLWSYDNAPDGVWNVLVILAGAGYISPDTAWQDTLTALQSNTNTYQSNIPYLSQMQALN